MCKEGGGRAARLCYFCDIDINGLIWGCVLFASAICLEIILLLTFTHNLCDDIYEARLWIYSDFRCLVAWMCVFSSEDAIVCVCVCVCVCACACVCVCV